MSFSQNIGAIKHIHTDYLGYTCVLHVIHVYYTCINYMWNITHVPHMLVQSTQISQRQAPEITDYLTNVTVLEISHESLQ